MSVDNLFDWLKARGREKSTWAGLASILAGIVGVDQFADPETVDLFGNTGVMFVNVICGVIGLVGVFKNTSGD